MFEAEMYGLNVSIKIILEPIIIILMYDIFPPAMEDIMKLLRLILNVLIVKLLLEQQPVVLFQLIIYYITTMT